MSDKVVNIFISYSLADKKYRDELVKHLEKTGITAQFNIWSDKDILPGENWENEIQRALEKAEIILLLVSPDFMASEYIRRKELPQSLQRNRWGQAIIIPIILRPVVWQDLKVGQYAALPQRGIPISTWDDTEEAWENVAKPIRHLVENLASGKTRLKERHPMESS